MHPFTSERRVRERMHVLAATGRVRRFSYATAGTGAPNYYTLTRLGYQILYGPRTEPPTKRSFGPVSIGNQAHALHLADFIVHTIVTAHAAAVGFTSFYRENTLRLEIGDQALYPDCSFQLVLPSGYRFNFFVELDNGTERIRSDKDTDSLERKVRLYDTLQDLASARFRVLVVTTRSAERLRHILHAARTLTRNPERRLIYGTSLSLYLSVEHAITTPAFLDHFGRPVSLVHEVRTHAAERPNYIGRFTDPRPVVC